jgi:hypothetical protein
MKLAKYALTPAENKLYTIDYTQWLAASETLLSVTFTVTPATVPPFAITSAAIALNGLSLSYHASGGVDGQTYAVVVTVTTSLTETKADAVFYVVKNI